MTTDKIQQVNLGWRSTCWLHWVNYRIEFCWIAVL